MILQLERLCVLYLGICVMFCRSDWFLSKSITDIVKNSLIETTFVDIELTCVF